MKNLKTYEELNPKKWIYKKIKDIGLGDPQATENLKINSKKLEDILKKLRLDFAKSIDTESVQYLPGRFKVTIELNSGILSKFSEQLGVKILGGKLIFDIYIDKSYAIQEEGEFSKTRIDFTRFNFTYEGNLVKIGNFDSTKLAIGIASAILSTNGSHKFIQLTIPAYKSVDEVTETNIKDMLVEFIKRDNIPDLISIYNKYSAELSAKEQYIQKTKELIDNSEDLKYFLYDIIDMSDESDVFVDMPFSSTYNKKSLYAHFIIKDINVVSQIVNPDSGRVREAKFNSTDGIFKVMKELSQVHTRIKSYNPDINMRITFKNNELTLEFSISDGRSAND